MKDLKVIFMGTPEFAIPSLEYLYNNTNVLLVLTQPDKEVGRKKIIEYSPVKKFALENNINLLQPININDCIDMIEKLNPDIIITAAYGKILPEKLLSIPKYGCINIHGSLLPKYRGATPIQSALLNGDTKTGITIMYMDKEMDTGNIISQEELTILENDNSGTLFNKLSIIGRNLLEKTLPNIINGTNDNILQDEKNATYTEKLTRKDELIDFNDNGNNIINKLRALSPFEYPYFVIDNEEFKIIEASFINKTIEPKKIEYAKSQMFIGCKDGAIEILKIKPVGKNIMDIKAFLNGYKKEKDYVD